MGRTRDAQEWERALGQQAAVAALGQLALRATDLDEVLSAAMTHVAEMLGIPDVVVFELTADAQAVRGRAAHQEGNVASRPLIDWLRLPVGRASLPGYVVGAGAVVLVEDLLADDRFDAAAPAYRSPSRAAIAAAITWGAQPWGVLVAYDRCVRPWTEDEARFVESVAVTIGLAVRRFQIETALRTSSTRLDLSLVAGGLGSWSWNVAADTVWLSEAAMAIFDIGPGGFEGTGDGLLDLFHLDDRAGTKAAAYAALRADTKQHRVFRLAANVSAGPRWVETWAQRFTDEEGEHLVGVIEDITDRRRAEDEREALLAGEQAARLEAEHARDRLSFVAEVSARLSQSLDLAVTLDAVTALCVPRLGDVCLVDLLEDSGSLVDHGASALDESSLGEVRVLRRRGGAGGIWSETDVARRGRIQLHRTLTNNDFLSASSDEIPLALFRHFGATSAVISPLVARGRTIGVMTLLRNSTPRPYETEDLTLVEEVARRTALAIDNGRLHESRTRVARSLQAALLPPTLPVVDGLALAARYEVGDDAAEIGGDFYDLVEVEPGVWGVVVGDVCGRGPDAAALTGVVRHSLRSAVVHERGPAAVLAHTNAAVLDQIDDTRFCTAAYLRVTVLGGSTVGKPREVEVVASSAGHPRPVVLRADGRAELISCGGTLLGVVPDPVLIEVRVILGAGDAIVLYTDGVTEARRGRELFGESGLLAALERLRGTSAESIAAGLHDAVIAYRDQASDDIAIVVIQAVGHEGVAAQP